MEIQNRPAGQLALWTAAVVNVAVFLLMSAEFEGVRFSAQQAAQWGAVYRPLVVEGELWRLLAANYIHFDLKHILFNMMALISWGGPVADRFGFLRFGILYTISGLAASLASLLTHPNTVCAGASGPISGVLGCLISLYWGGDKSLSGSGLFQAVLYTAIYSLIMPSIDWQAHAGGFIAGIFLGAILLWSIPRPNPPVAIE